MVHLRPRHLWSFERYLNNTETSKFIHRYRCWAPPIYPSGKLRPGLQLSSWSWQNVEDRRRCIINCRNLVAISNKLIKVELPPRKIWKAEVLSVSPPLERREELRVLVVFMRVWRNLYNELYLNVIYLNFGVRHNSDHVINKIISQVYSFCYWVWPYKSHVNLVLHSVVQISCTSTALVVKYRSRKVNAILQILWFTLVRFIPAGPDWKGMGKIMQQWFPNRDSYRR